MASVGRRGNNGFGVRSSPVIPYQVRFSCSKLGKRIQQSKRFLQFTFGFASLCDADAYGPACRGDEYTVEVWWSLASSKHVVKFDGHVVHRGCGGAMKGLYEGSLMHTFEVKRAGQNHILQVIAYAMPPSKDLYERGSSASSRRNRRARQFDFRLDGLSFFDFHQIYQLRGDMLHMQHMQHMHVHAPAPPTPTPPQNASALNTIQEEDALGHTDTTHQDQPDQPDQLDPPPPSSPPTVVLTNLPNSDASHRLPPTTLQRRNSDASVVSYASSSMLSFRPPTWEEQMEYDRAYLEDDDNYDQYSSLAIQQPQPQPQPQPQTQPQPQQANDRQRSIKSLGLDSFSSLHQAFHVDPQPNVPDLIDFERELDFDQDSLSNIPKNNKNTPITLQSALTTNTHKTDNNNNNKHQEEDLIDLSGLNITSPNLPTPLPTPVRTVHHLGGVQTPHNQNLSNGVHIPSTVSQPYQQPHFSQPKPAFYVGPSNATFAPQNSNMARNFYPPNVTHNIQGSSFSFSTGPMLHPPPPQTHQPPPYYHCPPPVSSVPPPMYGMQSPHLPPVTKQAHAHAHSHSQPYPQFSQPPPLPRSNVAGMGTSIPVTKAN